MFCVWAVSLILASCTTRLELPLRSFPRSTMHHFAPDSSDFALAPPPHRAATPPYPRALDDVLDALQNICTRGPADASSTQCWLSVVTCGACVFVALLAAIVVVGGVEVTEERSRYSVLVRYVKRRRSTTTTTTKKKKKKKKKTTTTTTTTTTPSKIFSHEGVTKASTCSSHPRRTVCARAASRMTEERRPTFVTPLAERLLNAANTVSDESFFNTNADTKSEMVCGFKSLKSAARCGDVEDQLPPDTPPRTLVDFNPAHRDAAPRDLAHSIVSAHPIEIDMTTPFPEQEESCLGRTVDCVSLILLVVATLILCTCLVGLFVDARIEPCVNELARLLPCDSFIGISSSRTRVVCSLPRRCLRQTQRGRRSLGRYLPHYEW